MVGALISWLDGLITWQVVNYVKLGVALGGVGVLLWGAVLRRAQRSHAQRRLRDGLLLTLGIAGALCWPNLLQFHYLDRTALDWVHFHDTYHYYVGSKYFRELGYTRLYECSAAAEVELGQLARVAVRRHRNLATNQLEGTSAILADPTRCTRHFSPERWEMFKHDVAWFRLRILDWDRVQRDWGYNPTPAWGALGGALANTGPVSALQLGVLTLLDVAILALMWSCVWWAFGWRATCVALIFWGTSLASQYSWTGGGYLRQDGLATSVVGICLLKRNQAFSSGLVLGYATLVRVVPVVIPAALALKALAGMIRERRLHLSAAHRKLALGGLLATAIVLPLSIVTAGGIGAWVAFVQNTISDLEPTSNKMGLQTLLSYRHDQRWKALEAELEPPALEEAWQESRREAASRTRLPFFALLGAFAILLGGAVERSKDWAAAALGVALMPVALEISSYYNELLLVFGLVWIRSAFPGVALCALSVGFWLVFQNWWRGGGDEVYTLASVLLVAFAVIVTAAARLCCARRDPS